MFEFSLALRYLVSSRLQTSLLVAGVAVGVLVFTFIAALMNGLGLRLTDDITANVAHVTLEPAPRLPRVFMAAPRGRALFAVQPGRDDAAVIRPYREAVELATRTPGVRVAVPEVLGNATLARGATSVAVVVTGIAPEQLGAIAPIDRALVRGRLALGVGDVLIGSMLARDLDVDVGDRLILRSAQRHLDTSPEVDREVDAVVTVRGIFTLGVQALDERGVYFELGAARRLFGHADGVSIIELKLDDVWQATALGDRLARVTGLEPTTWLERNARLQSGLRAQGSTGSMIKAFSLLTIAIGVASTLFLSVMRRRSEIGILRSFGIGRGAIVRTFVLQGVLLGLAGALVGIALGYGFAHLLRAFTMQASGTPSIPIDPAHGEYLRALLLATAASGVAAVLPAWSAARIDPLEAIQS